MRASELRPGGSDPFRCRWLPTRHGGGYGLACSAASLSSSMCPTRPMTRHSHEIFDSKGASRKVAQWARAAWSGVATKRQRSPTPATTTATPAPLHECPHASGSAERSAGGSAASHASLHAGPRASGSASGSPRLPPLTTTRIGDKSRVVELQGGVVTSRLRPVRSCAGSLRREPDDWGAWVWFLDVSKHYFPRFKAATGARYLQLGVLILVGSAL